MRRSALFVMILSLLFCQLNSSCSFFSGLCGVKRTSINELDIKVHDPSGYDRQILRPNLSEYPPFQSQSEDLVELKSILKKPDINQNHQETLSRRVSFSFNIDGIEEKNDEPTSIAQMSISFSNRRTSLDEEVEGSCVIFDQVPFDYELEDGEIVNDLMAKMELPYEMAEMIKFNYPGLGNFKVNALDFAGLILFAIYFNHPENYFNSYDLIKFFNEFLVIFPFSLPLIQSQSIKSNQGNFKITKMKAFDGIRRISHKYSLYYTLEAFYKIFGQANPEILIEGSIKGGDMKIFFRFLNENFILNQKKLILNQEKLILTQEKLITLNLDKLAITSERFIINPDKLAINPDKLIFWSLKYGNEQVYLNFIDFIGSIQNIKIHFHIPIICHVADNGFYFDGIVDLLFEFENENFDEALSLSIFNGNHKLFKDLIKYENSLFSRNHDPRVLNVLRSIFYNQVIEDDFMEVLEDTLIQLLLLSSDDPLVISSFKSTLNHFYNFSALKELLLISLFLKTREYFKIIIETFPMNYLLLIDDIKIGIWELVNHSIVYSNVMESLISTDSFSILHAIGNLEFPKVLWSQVLEKCKTPQFNEEEIEFKELTFNYGLNEDILNQQDLISLGLNGKRIWSLLELSILNFNSDAVEVILEKFPVDHHQKESIINLTKSLNDLINSSDYKMNHPMNYILIKKLTLISYKKMMPKLYFKDIQTIDYIMKLRGNINSIRRALLK